MPFAAKGKSDESKRVGNRRVLPIERKLWDKPKHKMRKLYAAFVEIIQSNWTYPIASIDCRFEPWEKCNTSRKKCVNVTT